MVNIFMQDRRFFLVAKLILLGGLWANPLALASEVPKVVVSIAPFHALVSAVMQGVGEPRLLLPVNASPHHYTLRPSQIKTLQKAEVIFWGGPLLETFLTKPLQNLAPKTTRIPLDKTPGLQLLNIRRTAFFTQHLHEEMEHEEIGHNEDMHFWLDPDNAKRLVNGIAQQLSIKDPFHKTQYFENAKQFNQKIEALDQQIKQRIQTVKNRPFVTFHDAYQYFEHHYGLMGVGTISLHPETPLSVARLQTIHDLIKKTKAICVFSEPQFKSNVVNAIVQATSVKTAELDPIGHPSSVPGQGYLNLLNNLSETMTHCLEAQPKNK